MLGGSEGDHFTESVMPIRKKKSINLIVKIPPGNLCKMYFVSFYINMTQIKLNIVYCLLEFKHAMLFLTHVFGHEMVLFGGEV